MKNIRTLKKSMVYRAGSIKRNFDPETSTITTMINEQNNSLVIRFKITAAGGGKTILDLEIREDDLRDTIKDLAKNMPQLADTFAESTYVAIKKSKELEKTEILS